MKLSSKALATGLVAGALVLGGNAIASASAASQISSYPTKAGCQAALVASQFSHPGASLECRQVTIDSQGHTAWWLWEN